MVSSLPKTANPKLRNPWDAIALFCHVCMLSVGFRLVGLGEDHRIGWFYWRLSIFIANITQTQIQKSTTRSLYLQSGTLPLLQIMPSVMPIRNHLSSSWLK